MMAAVSGQYTYYRLTTVFSGRTVGVVRHHRGPDDVRFEVWHDGRWEMANHYANIVLLGEDADEITEAEALTIIDGRGPSRSHSR